MINIEIADRTKPQQEFRQRTMRDLAEAFDYLRACYSTNRGLNVEFLLVETPPAFRRRAVSYVIPFKARITFFAEVECK